MVISASMTRTVTRRAATARTRRAGGQPAAACGWPCSAQQLRAAGGDATGEGGGGEVAVAQHQHPGVQVLGELVGHGRLAAAGGAEHHLDQAAGATGDQGGQTQQPIPRAAVWPGWVV
jgi:hypothetical protein